MLEIKRLRLLWELEGRGTIAAVAAATSYTPSAVSQQLARLERDAGVQLLRRTGRRLELTPAAEALVAETGPLLAHLEHVEATLHRAAPAITGTVRLAAFQTAMLSIVPPTLDLLHAEHPELRVEVVQYEPETALRETWARGFDLVVAEQYPAHAPAHFAGLDRRPLTDDPIHLALPPAATAPELSHIEGLEDAAALPWVMEPRGAASRHWAEQACRRAGFEPDVRYVTADLQAHVRLVETGHAAALLPGLVHESAPRVRIRSLTGAPRRTLFTAARRSARSQPALVAVRSALTRTVESPVG